MKLTRLLMSLGLVSLLIVSIACDSLGADYDVFQGIRLDREIIQTEGSNWTHCWHKCSQMTGCVATTFNQIALECAFFNKSAVSIYIDDADSVTIAYKNAGLMVKQAEILSEYIWRNSMDLAYKALSTTFISGIRNKSLSPKFFTRYMNQDAIYLVDSTEMHRRMLVENQHLLPADVLEYLNKAHKSLKSYFADFNQTYGIVDKTGLHGIRSFANCVYQKNQLSKKVEDVIYFVIANLPCYKLWRWLALEISDAKENNLYAFWIEENSEGSGGSTRRTEALINAYSSQLDKKRALSVFRDFMNHEISMFNLD